MACPFEFPQAASGPAQGCPESVQGWGIQVRFRSGHAGLRGTHGVAPLLQRGLLRFELLPGLTRPLPVLVEILSPAFNLLSEHHGGVEVFQAGFIPAGSEIPQLALQVGCQCIQLGLAFRQVRHRVAISLMPTPNGLDRFPIRQQCLQASRGRMQRRGAGIFIHPQVPPGIRFLHLEHFPLLRVLCPARVGFAGLVGGFENALLPTLHFAADGERRVDAVEVCFIPVGAQLSQLLLQGLLHVPQFLPPFREIAHGVVVAAPAAADGLDAIPIRQQGLAGNNDGGGRAGFSVLFPGVVAILPGLLHPLFQVFQALNRVLRQLLECGHVPQPRPTLFQGFPVLPAIQHSEYFGVSADQVAALQVRPVQFPFDAVPSAEQLAVPVGVGLHLPDPLVDVLELAQQLGDALRTASRLVKFVLAPGQRLAEQRQSGSPHARAVDAVGHVRAVQQAHVLQFIDAERENVLEKVGRGAARELLQRAGGAEFLAGFVAQDKSPPFRTVVPFKGEGFARVAGQPDSATVPASSQRGIVLIALPLRKAEENGPDECQQGALARFVGTVNHGDGCVQGADGLPMEPPKTVQVELFKFHVPSSPVRAARHSSSAASRMVSSSSSVGIKFFRYFRAPAEP